MASLDTRAVERDSLFLMADLVFAADVPGARVKVRNLSAGGMMVEGDLGAKRGARVAVELRNIGRVTGVVVWVRSPRFGIAFEKEIDPKLARTPVFDREREAMVYARAAVGAPRRQGWSGKLRRI